MTSFTDLVNGVYTETKRPDLVSETAQAIRKAVLKYHTSEKWIKDLQSAIVPLTPLYSGDSRYQIDLTVSPFTRFRDIHSVQEYNNPPTGQFIQFKKHEIDDLLVPSYDDWGIERTNYYYRAGTSLNLRANKALTNVLVSYYWFPDNSQATFSSWIADIDPDAIIQEACIRLFAMIGKMDSAKVYSNYFQENMAQLRTYGIVSGD